MKNTVLLFVCLIVFSAVSAQVSDSAMKPLMQYRMYDCYEVEYNAIVLAPRLYNENAGSDSLSALVAYWKKHCTPNERLFSLALLTSIRDKTFKEHINENEFMLPRNMTTFDGDDIYHDNVLSYLSEYSKSCDGAFSDQHYKEWLDQNYPLPKDITEYYAFFKTYYSFLRQMARGMLGKRAYAPVEDFLLRFYAHPDSTHISGLDSAMYNGTVLSERYRMYKMNNERIHGLSSNLHVGMWVPNGPLATLGSHPYVTYAIGGRTEHFLMDWSIGFRPGSSPSTYQVKVSILAANCSAPGKVSWMCCSGWAMKNCKYFILHMRTRAHQHPVTA